VYSTVALPSRIATVAISVPTSITQYPVHPSLVERTRGIARYVLYVNRPVMKKVVNTSAISTPCAVSVR